MAERTFADICAPLHADTAALTQQLRELVLSTLPDLTETIGGGVKVAMAFYHGAHPNDVICVIQPGSDHCKLYIHHVIGLDAGHLTLVGKGKTNRHVKLTQLDADTCSVLQTLLQEAAKRSPHQA